MILPFLLVVNYCKKRAVGYDTDAGIVVLWYLSPTLTNGPSYGHQLLATWLDCPTKESGMILPLGNFSELSIVQLSYGNCPVASVINYHAHVIFLSEKPSRPDKASCQPYRPTGPLGMLLLVSKPGRPAAW